MKPTGKIPVGFEDTYTGKEKLKELWVRAGMTLKLTEEEVKTLETSDADFWKNAKEIFIRALEEGRAYLS